MYIETILTCLHTELDVIMLIDLCRYNILPRVTRRLTYNEKKLIKDGSVFVYEETESKMKRWTDGRLWSPSRSCGIFLGYREYKPMVNLYNDSGSSWSYSYQSNISKDSQCASTYHALDNSEKSFIQTNDKDGNLFDINIDGNLFFPNSGSNFLLKENCGLNTDFSTISKYNIPARKSSISDDINCNNNNLLNGVKFRKYSVDNMKNNRRINSCKELGNFNKKMIKELGNKKFKCNFNSENREDIFKNNLRRKSEIICGENERYNAEIEKRKFSVETRIGNNNFNENNNLSRFNDIKHDNLLDSFFINDKNSKPEYLANENACNAMQLTDNNGDNSNSYTFDSSKTKSSDSNFNKLGSFCQMNDENKYLYKKTLTATLKNRTYHIIAYQNLEDELTGRCCFKWGNRLRRLYDEFTIYKNSFMLGKGNLVPKNLNKYLFSKCDTIDPAKINYNNPSRVNDENVLNYYQRNDINNGKHIFSHVNQQFEDKSAFVHLGNEQVASRVDDINGNIEKETVSKNKIIYSNGCFLTELNRNNTEENNEKATNQYVKNIKSIYNSTNNSLLSESHYANNNQNCEKQKENFLYYSNFSFDLENQHNLKMIVNNQFINKNMPNNDENNIIKIENKQNCKYNDNLTTFENLEEKININQDDIKKNQNNLIPNIISNNECAQFQFCDFNYDETNQNIFKLKNIQENDIVSNNESILDNIKMSRLQTESRQNEKFMSKFKEKSENSFNNDDNLIELAIYEEVNKCDSKNPNTLDDAIDKIKKNIFKEEKIEGQNNLTNFDQKCCFANNLNDIVMKKPVYIDEIVRENLSNGNLDANDIKTKKILNITILILKIIIIINFLILIIQNLQKINKMIIVCLK
ncbi:hypothetical protein EDEG_02593 [Edhazardia aedis USNM 41457]|uniref:Uncharacterized protein n=1 Tax=Edhazardia aedis (strain USNM 41457) TaxID=1003232 RepID=J9D5D8_EDHAE|nr:hypothetical protein EDEG_02593 [Edhazardia aedis USNM 41457]|eukprot:EJW03011.1 hypothetical protein EDEG_02593 [Edhazardia aedis USNM 41457]